MRSTWRRSVSERHWFRAKSVLRCKPHAVAGMHFGPPLPRPVAPFELLLPLQPVFPGQESARWPEPRIRKLVPPSVWPPSKPDPKRPTHRKPSVPLHPPFSPVPPTSSLPAGPSASSFRVPASSQQPPVAFFELSQALPSTWSTWPSCPQVLFPFEWWMRQVLSRELHFPLSFSPPQQCLSPTP